MQADEVQNAKEPIAAQIDLSGQTLGHYAKSDNGVELRGTNPNPKLRCNTGILPIKTRPSRAQARATCSPH